MYEKYYQLSNLPFRLSPDPSIFFGSKGHNRALSYLRYGLAQKEGFIVITGAPGTGKTTIARSLLEEIGKEKIVVAELNTTHLQAEDVLRMVAASFRLEHENAPKATILKRLEAFCTSRFKAGYHVLLLVDESQNLPPESLEELRMLSNFYLGKDALIQIFLLGQQQFRDNLYSKEMEQLRQRVVASCHLEPLNITETREYIEFRLKCVGWEGDPNISDRAFARIYFYTKGVPRRINTFCDRLFLFGAIEEIHLFQDEHIKEVAKELAYEVSAEGVKLEEISPEDILSDGNIAPGSVKLEKSVESERELVLDTQQLQKFSDEAKVEDSDDQGGDFTVSSRGSDNSGLDSFYPASETTSEIPVLEHENILQFNGRDNTARSIDAASQAASITNIHQARNISPSWWELLSVCIEYYKQPAKYRSVSVDSHALDGIGELLQVATGKKEIPDYVRTGIIENITDSEIKDAIRLYIQNVLLCRNSDYYRRLGVSNNASMELIKAHYKHMFALFQPDAEGQSSEWDEIYTRRINQAYGTLRSVEKRQDYDQFLASRSRVTKTQDIPSKQFDHSDDSDTERLNISEDNSTDQSAFTTANNLNAKLHERKPKRSLVISLSVMLFGGLVAIYLYQPEMKKLIAFGGGGSEVNESLIQTATESAELEKILEPVESKLDPKVNTLKEIASAVEETFIKNNDSDLLTDVSKSLTSESKSPVKQMLQARIEQAPETVFAGEKGHTVDISSRAVLSGEKSAMLSTAPVSVVNSEAVNKISYTELKSFVTDFSIAYEEGNLNDLMRFFTKNAVVNNTKSKKAIKADYASLFSSTDMRVIDLHGVSWEIKNQKAIGQGEFLITVLKKGAETMKNFSGTIKLEVTKSKGKVRLAGMKHTYSLEN